MIGLILSLIVIGLIAGALARLIVPGKQEMSIPMTILIGIIGSFVGGFIGYLLVHEDSQDGFFQPSGIIGSVIGAPLIVEGPCAGTILSVAPPAQGQTHAIIRVATPESLQRVLMRARANTGRLAWHAAHSAPAPRA